MTRSAVPACAAPACAMLSALAAAPIFAAAAEGQDAPRLELGSPTVAYADGLGSLRGARELSDGRVLIADGFGAALIVWTPGGGADTLTNVGQGPQEYHSPDDLLPLPDDATLLVDLGNARLTRIESDLSFGDTWPIARGGIGPTMSLTFPAATDGAGGVYFEERAGGIAGTRGGDADSLIISRLDLASGETSELGRLRAAAVRREESGGGNNRNVSIVPIPYAGRDAWSASWDGRVAVARVEDYRLDWIAPDGTVTAGEPVEHDPVRVRGGDRDEWLARLGGGLRVEAVMDGGGPRLSMSRGASGAGDRTARDFEWPSHKPAFPQNAVAVDREGRAWVRRHVPAGDAPLYDVFDVRGRRLAQVELPEERTLDAFGDGSAYLARTDALGFAWLEKYALPDLP